MTIFRSVESAPAKFLPQSEYIDVHIIHAEIQIWLEQLVISITTSKYTSFVTRQTNTQIHVHVTHCTHIEDLYTEVVHTSGVEWLSRHYTRRWKISHQRKFVCRKL